MQTSTTSPCKAPTPAPDADLIFVLAGLEERKAFGLQLFCEGRAPELILSVGRFEIRKLSRLEARIPIDLLEIARSVPPPQRHFFVWLRGSQATAHRIPLTRCGTLSEMKALANWLMGRPEIKSVLFVSSDFHLFRVRLCQRALLRERIRASFLSSPPEMSGVTGAAQFRWSKQWRVQLVEIVKITVYAALLWYMRRSSAAKGA